MMRGVGVGAWGDVSPKGSEPKEMWGDKVREGTPKIGILGRRLLWMVPKIIHTRLDPSLAKKLKTMAPKKS